MGRIAIAGREREREKIGSGGWNRSNLFLAPLGRAVRARARPSLPAAEEAARDDRSQQSRDS